MNKIVLLYHVIDRVTAARLRAALSKFLDPNEHEIWSPESRTAFSDGPSQLEQAISGAWAVVVIVGSKGVDDEFKNLAQGAVLQKISAAGRSFGRLRLDLPDCADMPSALQSWVPVETADPISYDATAEAILAKLELKPRWSASLDMEHALAALGASTQPILQKHFADVARRLADGKPLTLLVGPYASVDEIDNGSCPSRIRTALLELIDDQVLRHLLAPDSANLEHSLPLLWQDHLATLCLLSDQSRESIANAISEAVSLAPGDAHGPPEGVFKAIGDLVSCLFRLNLRRSAGLPAATIITVCPGLRVERALISKGCPFERATLLWGENGRPDLHQRTYVPTPALSERAALGDEDFMPDATEVGSSDAVELLRLVKLGGSRDLYGGIYTDFAQEYGLLSELRPYLEKLVAAVGSGPYLALGGGLGTPPVQVAHAILLRSALQMRELLPRLALVSPATASRDPLRRAEGEIKRLTRLTKVPDSGFDRLQVVSGSPTAFLKALFIAFGGELPRRAA